MCGIVGVIQYQSDVPRETRQRALRILFSSAMLGTEHRGEDATGVYQIHPDGDWLLTKKGLKVSDWVFQKEGGDDPIVYSDVMSSWHDHSQEMTALVGHCRKATVGSRGRDNDDNHPFAIQVDERAAILGIHNGTLKNHAKIFDNLPEMLERQGTVDSEAIFHALFHLSEQGRKPFDGDMIRDLGRRLDGAFACITVNTKFPHQVATFRDGRPMEYFLISPLNIVLITSETAIGKEALESYNFYRHMVDQSLPALEHHNRCLIERDWRIFDVTKKFPKGKPVHGDLDKISEGGTIRTYNEEVEKGWESPEEETTATKTPPTKTSTTAFSAKTSKSSAARPGKITAPANSKDDDDTGTVVEMEVEGTTPEMKEAVAKAKSLGASLNFEGPKEMAEALGLTVPELTGMNLVDVANLIAQMGFNVGYAVCRFDTETETEAVRLRGREQNLRLEKAESKLDRAQKHIWENRNLIAIMHALSVAGHTISPTNILRTAEAFPRMSTVQRAAILNIFEEIRQDRGTKKLAGRIRDVRNSDKQSLEKDQSDQG